MLHKGTIEFLKELKRNNNKEWFEKNRPAYENAKRDLLPLVEHTIKALSKQDSAYSLLEPAKCLFRINRDVRFSKDKSPYKTNFGASFQLGGKQSGNAAYYIHIEPGNSFIGGGLWGPDPKTLKDIRQELDYNFEEFRNIIGKPAFKKTFGAMNTDEALKKVPKGYDPAHPAAEYLKLKHFVTGKQYSDSELSAKDLYKKIEMDFITLTPLIQYLNRVRVDA